MSGDFSSSPPDPGVDEVPVDGSTGSPGPAEPTAGEGAGGGAGDAGPAKAHGDALLDGQPGPGFSEGPASEGAGPGSPVDPLTAVTAERDEYLDSLRRLQAEFENYKKRMLRQQTEHLDRAAENLVVKLLPVLDTIDLARSHVDPEGETGRSLDQVSSALYDILGKEGLEKVDPLGQPFDPNEAEAVMHEPAGDDDPGQGGGHEVTEVLRAGFKWKGRVVRPAMVKVKG